MWTFDVLLCQHAPHHPLSRSITTILGLYRSWLTTPPLIINPSRRTTIVSVPLSHILFPRQSSLLSPHLLCTHRLPLLVLVKPSVPEQRFLYHSRHLPHSHPYYRAMIDTHINGRHVSAHIRQTRLRTILIQKTCRWHTEASQRHPEMCTCARNLIL